MKEAVREGDFGIATVAAVVTLDGKQQIRDAKIVLGCQSQTPVRAQEAEKAIIGKTIKDDLKEIGLLAAREARPVADVNGSVNYKRQIVGVITRNAVVLAMERAQKGGSI